jgi:hypothetical protein
MKTLMTTLFVTLTLVGCSGSAQLVRTETGGGRAALQGAFMPAMGEARLLMATHCHGRFEATEQGRTVEFRCQAQPGQGTRQLALASHADRGL